MNQKPIATMFGRSALPPLSSGDPRVRRELDRKQLRYEVDSDGDFRLTFDLGGGRSQTIYINSNTERFHNIEIREVWSFSLDLPGVPDPGLMLFLLKQNRTLKFGSWRVAEASKGSYVIFAAQVGASADADTLYAIMEMVMEVADDLEQMYGQDQN